MLWRSFRSHHSLVFVTWKSLRTRGMSLQEETIEQEINRGQLEELIEQGNMELKLIDKYYEWRMWEVVEKMNSGRKELDSTEAPEDADASTAK